MTQPTAKKRGGSSSKVKGSAFERELCKQLSLWISHGIRDDLYWRSATSGGRATVHGKKGKGLEHVAGDICAIHPDGKPLTDQFFLEAKHYQNPEWHKFFLTASGPVQAFWEKLTEQADSYQKFPILIVKQNMYPIQVVCLSRMFRVLDCSTADLEEIYLRHRFLSVITFNSFLTIPPEKLLWTKS